MNFDQTFCASPNCMNDCGRKMTEQEQQYIDDLPKSEFKRVSYGYFCNFPGWLKDNEIRNK